MSVSQCSIQLASYLQAPQLRADRPVHIKQDPSPNVKSEHNVLCCNTQLDNTHTDAHTKTQMYSYSKLPVEGGEKLGGDWGPEREDRTSSLLHTV